MSIQKKWSKFKKENMKKLPNVYGVYELRNEKGEVIYIGEGKVKERMQAHFSSGSDPIPGTTHYRQQPTGGKRRAVERQNTILEQFKQKHGKFPRFNQKKRG